MHANRKRPLCDAFSLFFYLIFGQSIRRFWIGLETTWYTRRVLKTYIDTLFISSINPEKIKRSYTIHYAT